MYNTSTSSNTTKLTPEGTRQYQNQQQSTISNKTSLITSKPKASKTISNNNNTYYIIMMAPKEVSDYIRYIATILQ